MSLGSVFVRRFRFWCAALPPPLTSLVIDARLARNLINLIDIDYSTLRSICLI